MKFKRCMTILVCRLPFLLGTLALLIFFTGAKPAAAATPAFVRIIHASPDVGTADVFVDGSVLLSSFQFGAITDYAAIPPGPHKVQIALVGKGVGGSLITQTLAVSPGIAYTVAATGTKATGLGLEVFIDDNVVTGNMAKVRVYHLSPDAGPVDVATGGNKVITGLAYKQASDYLMVPAGSYTFDVTATEANATVQTSASLKSGMVTSVFAIGLLKGEPKLQFVAATTRGVPGMPNDGSDPNAVPASSFSQAPWLWLAGALALLTVSIAVLGRRLALARQPAQK